MDGDGSVVTGRAGPGETRFRSRANLVFVREDLALALFIQRQLPGAMLSLERTADNSKRNGLFVLRLRLSSADALRFLVMNVLQNQSWNSVRRVSLERYAHHCPDPSVPSEVTEITPPPLPGANFEASPPLN